MTADEIQSRQEALIETLKKNGSLKSPEVEAAFRAVPRHLFLPGEPLDKVYSDIAIVVKQGEEGQWTSSSSQPAIMAIMLEQLDLRPGMRVLEIGAGTGFNAALIAEMVGPKGQVTTIDIQPDLIEAARERLAAAGYGQVRAVAADGGYGDPEGAPYDRIILTVSSLIIAPAWREQLAQGGRLVLPLNIGGPQVSVALERRGNELVSLSLVDCGFMPLQGAFSAAQPVRTQVGPDPSQYVLSSQPLPVDADTLADWLSTPGEAQPSGVKITEQEIWSGLFSWLILHLPEWIPLLAEGELTARADFPALLFSGRGEEYRLKQSVLLAQPGGAAVLDRSPGRPAPFHDWIAEDTGEREGPFELYIRALGPESAAVERLRNTLREWDAAGKPTSARLQVRALPAEQEVFLAPGEFLLDRPWTKFLLRYAESA